MSVVMYEFLATSLSPIVTFAAVTLDGIDDVVSRSPIPATIGSVLIGITTGATAFATRGDQVLLASADTSAANEWFEIGINSDGRLYAERNSAGTRHRLVGQTYLEQSTSYAVLVTWDGTGYYACTGETEQNPLMLDIAGTPGWFGSVASADNLTLGGTVTSAGLVRPFQGAALGAEIYDVEIT